MDPLLDAYRSVQARVGKLVTSGADPGQAVPACPAWTVHDVVAHLAGLAEDWCAGNLDGYASEAWTEAQRARGADVPLGELVERWRTHASALGDVADHPLLGSPAQMAFGDAITHEADLRGALEAERVPDAAVRLAMKSLIARWRQTLAAAGVPSLLVRVRGVRDWPVGAAPHDVTLDVDAYDLFRALTGRRSARQVAAWSWSGDPQPYLDAGLPYPFSWSATDLVE